MVDAIAAYLAIGLLVFVAGAVVVWLIRDILAEESEP